jgi:hypothetical protein
MRVKHSHNFRRPEGLVRFISCATLEPLFTFAFPRKYITIRDKGKIGQILRNWPRINEARISVVTDGLWHDTLPLRLFQADALYHQVPASSVSATWA